MTKFLGRKDEEMTNPNTLKSVYEGCRMIAVDTETTGLDPKNDNLIGIGFATSHYDSYSRFPFQSCGMPDPLYQDEWTITKLLKDPECTKVFHNATFDIEFLENNGFKVAGEVVDTRHLAFLVNENCPLGLKDLSKKYLPKENLVNYERLCKKLEEQKTKFGNLSSAPFEYVSEYCKEDARNTLQLYKILREKCADIAQKQQKMGYAKSIQDYLIDEFRPTEYLLNKLNKRGIKVNEALVKQVAVGTLEKLTYERTSFLSIFKTEIEVIREVLWEKEKAKRKTEKGKMGVPKPEFNIDSGFHLGMLFAGGFKFKFPKTPTGRAKIDEASLQDILDNLNKSSFPDETLNTKKCIEGINCYLRYKELQKLYSTYVVGIQERVRDGRVYPKYYQVSHGKTEISSGGTVTGRLSSRDPNIQNLPRGSVVKRFFTPDSTKHCFVYADYSQLELRLAAHASNDPKMVTAFREGLDLHKQTADAIWSNGGPNGDKELGRQVGKTVNFLLIYGGGVNKLINTVKSATTPSPEEAAMGKVAYEPTWEEASYIRKAFFETYNVYADYLEHQKELLERFGHVVSDYGLVRRLPDSKLISELDFRRKIYTGDNEEEYAAILTSKGQEVNTLNIFQVASKKYFHAINQGLNFPIQSAGASICKRAMLALDKAGFDIVQQVHDSIVVQVDKEVAESKKVEIQGIIENVVQLRVPLKVDIKLTNSVDDKDSYEFCSS